MTQGVTEVKDAAQTRFMFILAHHTTLDCASTHDNSLQYRIVDVKETSTFPWSYGESETCYFLEGEVEVTPDGGEPVVVGKGDLVTFPEGMSCTWTVRSPVRKHYRFG